MTERSPLSPALLAAQELLYQKRAEARAERLRRGLPVDQHLQQSAVAVVDPQPSFAAAVAQLPAHLGWGSAQGARAVRAALIRQEPTHYREEVGQPNSQHDQTAAALQDPDAILQPTVLCLPEDAPQVHTLTDQTVKVYAELATAMLRAGYAPQARVYYLLRFIDQKGQGWLATDLVRDKLTSQNCLLRIANKKTTPTNAWRNLRGILNGGEGIFWTRDNQNRLWLRSAAKIAVNLNCSLLSGYPVALPVKKLLGKLKQVKAHLYATFHTGREKDLTKQGAIHRPISQAIIRELTGIPETTQRRYNKEAQIRVYHHYATGRKYDRERLKDALYERWGNAFQFTDYNGKQGASGATYIAQRLPNSYRTKTLQTSKGRQEKINKHIDLVTNVGEEGAQVELLSICAPSSLTQPMRGTGVSGDRLFFSDGKQAKRAQQRQPNKDHFQQSPVRIRSGGRIWYQHQKEQAI